MPKIKSTLGVVIPTLFCAVLLTASSLSGQAQAPLRSLDFDALEDRIRNGSDTLYVVNFWATWCGPCVRELPYLESFHEKNKGGAVKVLLVSLDFSRQLDSKLKPFLEQRALQSEVIHLDAPNANSWIDRVSPEWSGAIPATLVRRGDKEIFHEGSFSSMKEIESLVNAL